MEYHRFGLSPGISPGRSLLFVSHFHILKFNLDVDPTCRFMLTAGGNRGWGGNTTEVVIGYEIGVVG